MCWCSAEVSPMAKASPRCHDRRLNQNGCWKLRNQSGCTERGGGLATVKVWPADVGVGGKVGATANLDSVCARRLRAAMPERISVRCKGSATLDNKETGTIDPPADNRALGNIPG